MGSAGGEMSAILQPGIDTFDAKQAHALERTKFAGYLRARNTEALIAAMTHSSA